jgi:chemotaxis protein histidine kinase CheA
MPDDAVKLSLDYGDTAKDTGTVISALDKLKAAAQIAGVEGFDELIDKLKEADEAFRETAQTTDAVGQKSGADLSQLGNAFSGLLQAFKGGDVPGTIGSITTLIGFIPKLAAFAGPIGAVGAVIATAIPLIKGWADELTKSIGGVQEAVKSAKEYAAALREGNIELEKSEALSKAKEADKTAAETPSRLQAERGAAFTALSKQRNEEAISEIFDALKGDEAAVDAAVKEKQAEVSKEWEDKITQALAEGESETGFRVTVLKAYRNAARMGAHKLVGQQLQADAEKLFAQAQAGDADALERLQQMLPEGSTTREVARLASPENMAEAARAKAAAEETRQRNLEERKRAAEDEQQNRATLEAADQRQRDWRSQQAEAKQQEQEQARDAARELAQQSLEASAGGAARMEDLTAKNERKWAQGRQRVEALEQIQAQTGATREQARALYDKFQADEKRLMAIQAETIGVITGFGRTTAEKIAMWQQFLNDAQQMNRSQGSWQGTW